MPTNRWLSLYAKLCVFVLLGLILLGALVTTYDAGMAVPTWPTINGQMNPPGWTNEMLTRLEHSHRLTAMSVGVLVGVLCAWIWGNIWALGVAVGVSSLAGGAARYLKLDGNLAMQLTIWPAAVVFVLFLLYTHRRAGGKVTSLHRLALVVFFCVCIQAVMGGYRVTLETAGNDAVKAAQVELALAKSDPADAAKHTAAADQLGAKAEQLYPLATNLRIVHGIFAQFTLLLLVILAARLSPIAAELAAASELAGAPKIHRMAKAAIGLYFLQLACGAYLRHRNLGMLIPTWPGGWPEVWTFPVMVHFLHSRVLPFLLFGHILGMAIGTAKRARGQGRLVRPGFGLLALVVIQIAFGALIIFKGGRYTGPHAVNSHVVNGALILATAGLLATRARLLSPRATA